MSDKSPLISVIIATRNEERHIEEAIRSVLCGDIDWHEMEIVVADGLSTDRTREIVQRLAGEFPGSVRLIENPQKIAPTAFNLALKASRGKFVSILCAHETVDPNYFQVCLDKLNSSDVDAVGGLGTIVSTDETLSSRMTRALLSSQFGVGPSFRNIPKEGPVDAISPGLFRRQVFEKYGLFDERLVRNQDNEHSARIITSGGHIYMIPRIKSYYHGRRTVKKLLRQCYMNGLYGILTWRINPSSFRLRHGIPMFFVLFLVYGAVMSMLHTIFAWAYLGILAFYFALALAASVEAAVKFRLPAAALFPVLFATMHITYGTGTIMGIFRFALKRLPPSKVEYLPPLKD